MENQEKRRQMYINYMRHIKSLLEESFDEDYYIQQFKDIDKNIYNAQWIPIVHETQEIGFLIICTHPNCHPDADWYIENAYIIPEYQNQGHMQRAVQNWLKEHPGRYCLFIIDKNYPARHMWETVFKKAGYIPFKLKHVIPQKKGVTQYGWQRR